VVRLEVRYSKNSGRLVVQAVDVSWDLEIVHVGGDVLSSEF